MAMPDGTEVALLIYTDVSKSSKEIAAMTERYNLFRQDNFVPIR